MAHPKRKISKQRRDKRRTHQYIDLPQLSTCSETGEIHIRHRAFWLEDKLYYKGEVIMERNSKT